MHKLFAALILAASIFSMSITNAYAPMALPDMKVAQTYTAHVGEQKKITFTLQNPQSKEQPYICIMHIKDEEGFTDQLSWVQGVFEAGQEFRIYQSWIPEKAGEYEVEIFLWESADNPVALSPFWTMKVIVEP